jgi:hypothetical protein
MKKTANKKSGTKKVKATATPKREYHTVTKGKDNHYGTRNCIAHGRFAQGGLIDQFFIKSVKTGKTFTLEDIEKQRLLDNKNRPETPPMNPINYSRFDGHKQHLIGVHNAHVYDETISVKDNATGKPVKVKAYGMDWLNNEPMVDNKGNPITKEQLLADLTI